MVAPLIAASAAQKAGNALAGDIWTRTTLREVGKGADKRLVESTVRVNAGTALVGAGALGVLAVGAGITMFMLGLKVKPETKTVTYGKWVWPDGADASTIRESTLMGQAPTRKIGSDQPGYWDPNFWTGMRCLDDGSTLDTTDSIAVAKWLLNHRTHNYEKVYTPTWFEATYAEVQTATWVETSSKDKFGVIVTERPTLAEGLTGAVNELASVPLDIAFAPFTLINDISSHKIQDLKDWLRLP